MGKCEECEREVDAQTSTFEQFPYCIECFIKHREPIRQFSIDTAEDPDRYSVNMEYDGPLGSWQNSSTFDTLEEAEAHRDKRQRLLSWVLLLELTEDQFIVCLSTSKGDAEIVTTSLLDSALGEWIENTELFPLWNLREQGFSWLFCIRLALWRTGFSRLGTQTVSIDDALVKIDSRAYISEELRIEIEDELKERAIGSVDFNEIETLQDAKQAGSDLYQTESKVFHTLSYVVEKYARNNREVLSPVSLRMASNNVKGREFESFFADLTTEKDISVDRGRQTYFWVTRFERLKEREQNYPDTVSDQDRRRAESKVNQLPSLCQEVLSDLPRASGLPDFYLHGPKDVLETYISKHHNAGSVKIENPSVYVEVKYTETSPRKPHITDNQREVIPKLTEAGIDVFFFIGEPEQFHFERSSLSPRE
ncbi:hypothetical protein SAMN04487950_4459 [Halogranum rubrum]|uniref:Uncharacterized protein n=1 Tax=Halogranum rubrum TaxID=553466 RepID=A0A1I4JBW1_9EURY|nr:hypothetical protein [Halogranum rubrum]SFL64059.1 hypothetical protein SAMN04487950_4459 [Halogranum rubrum]